MKTCSECKEEKPLSEFYPRPDRPVGHRAKCRTCYRKSTRDSNRRHKERIRGTEKETIRHLVLKRGYSLAEATELAPVLLSPDTRCSICGMPNWLIKLNYRKGGPFFAGNRDQHSRVHPDRIDTTQAHTLANTRILCPHCNIKRGAERHTDVEVLRWIRQRWQSIFSPRLLWWLHSEPGKGGRARRNPNARGVQGVRAKDQLDPSSHTN